MPLTNQAKQQLRNFYKKKKRTVTVSRANSANNKTNKTKLSPRRRVTKTGRPINVYPTNVRAPSGKVYSIQTVRNNSRSPWNIR